jgi:hypothetical protein
MHAHVCVARRFENKVRRKRGYQHLHLAIVPPIMDMAVPDHRIPRYQQPFAAAAEGRDASLANRMDVRTVHSRIGPHVNRCLQF